MENVAKYYFKPLVFFRHSFERMTVRIETERLIIQSYKHQDLEDTISLYSDGAVTKYFDDGNPRTADEVKKLVFERGEKYSLDRKPFGLFSVFSKHNGEFLGQIDFIPVNDLGVVEIGYIFHMRHHGQGYCIEAMRAIVFEYTDTLNRCFDFEEFPVCKIIATVHPMNIKSQNVLKKLGMHLEKIRERFGTLRLWYSLNLSVQQYKIGSQ